MQSLTLSWPHAEVVHQDFIPEMGTFLLHAGIASMGPFCNCTNVLSLPVGRGSVGPWLGGMGGGQEAMHK